MLEIERAEGNYLIDINGKRYLDLISGISVSSLGHGNERVKQAIREQADIYMHLMVYGEFIQSPQVKLARKLASLLPPTLDTVYLVNSGTEATEGAMKLAKRHTGRPHIVACRNSYHGSTQGALSLNSNEFFRNPFRPLLPGILFIDYNQPASISMLDESVACVIVEVVQGEAGYIPADATFLQALRQACNKYGILLVFDEIQTGMGKTGSMFAFEQYGVVPDILLLGKALGAGMPIGAFISSNAIMSSLTDNPYLGHTTTFGGHPVIAAAALAGIEELEEKGYVSEVIKKGMLFRECLAHPQIKNISGSGLMLALEIGSFEDNLRVIRGCIDDGLITDWFLFATGRLRIAPPLTITEGEIRWASEIIKRNLNRLQGS